MRATSASIAHGNFSRFNRTIALQRLQIDCWHSRVEGAVGSHEVDLTNPISSRTLSCLKRSPAQDGSIISQPLSQKQGENDVCRVCTGRQRRAG